MVSIRKIKISPLCTARLWMINKNLGLQLFEEDNRRQIELVRAALPDYNRSRGWDSIKPTIGESSSQWIEDFLAGSQPRNVLDIGCGTGQALVDLARRFPQHQYYGIDLAVENHSPAPHVFIHEGDLQKLPFDYKMFDIVYGEFAFPYVTDKLRGISEAHRVLRKGGRGFIDLHPSLVEFVGRGGEMIFESEKDVTWRADGRVYLEKDHSRIPFGKWAYLCREETGLAGMVKSVYVRV